MKQQATVRLHTSQVLTANQRLHWREEAKRKAVLVRWGQLKIGRELRPVTGQHLVTAEFKFPTKRRRDRANLHATVKPILDGIVKAGILYDDSDAYIEGPDIVIHEETSGVPGFVLVTITLEDMRSVRRRRLAELEAQILRERDAADAEKARAKAAARLAGKR